MVTIPAITNTPTKLSFIKTATFIPNEPTKIDTTKFKVGKVSLEPNTPIEIDISKFNAGKAVFILNELPILTTSVDSDNVLTIEFTQGTQVSLDYTEPSLETGFYTAGTAASLVTESGDALTDVTSVASGAAFDGTFGSVSVTSTENVITAVGAISAPTAAGTHTHDVSGTAKYNS